jgi:putative phosphoesterase
VKVGLISDIHGNFTALSRALELMGDVDELFCLGDSINQYRFCNETVALLRGREAHVILGNHEEVFFSRLGERARAAAWIDRDLMDWLGSHPHRLDLTLAGRRVLLVHSTPWPSGGAYVLPHHADFARFGETSAEVVAYGHTHQPVAQRVGATLVLNPGSTGEARLVEGRLELSCAVLDLATDQVRHIAFPE